MSFFYKKIFFYLCSKIKSGFLQVFTPDKKIFSFGQPDSLLNASLHILDESFFANVICQGDWGLGWSYVFKKWDSPNIKNVCLILMLNEYIFRPYLKITMILSPFMQKIMQQDSHNQLSEEEIRKKTVSQCYDIGNDFYSWMLGPSMIYTCAIWPHKDASLEEAQENKLRIIVEKAGIEKQHSVIDLGCGFGTLCNYIHEKIGAHVKGITLSKEQVKWAKENYPHLEFDYLNYINMEGVYDRIVSVGMGEHVGRNNFDHFLNLVSDHLKPGGRFVCHMMCCHDGVLMYNNNRRYTSFASVAMPNGDVSSLALVTKAAMKTNDMRVIHAETFGIHYARTCEEWLKNIIKNKANIIRHYSEELYRTYLYSWNMGMAGFETGMTLLHVIFEKKPYGSDYNQSAVHNFHAREIYVNREVSDPETSSLASQFA